MGSPRFAWGIDVGNRALKAVKLVRDGSGSMRIDDVDVIEHEHILSDAGDNKESLVTQSLHAFAAKHPEKGGAVAIGVSGQSSFARFIKLPPVEEKKLPEIIRFEAIQQIPFPLDDVEWSYQLFEDANSPEKEVGIFAMRKEIVNQYIGNFTGAGLNVQVVQMNPLAVYNAMYFDQRLKGTTMIVDVGAENTDLIISDGENVWLRSISVGGNNFTEALVKQFKLKFLKAEELKRNAATSKYTRQILQAMRPVFDNLVAEIQRSIGFYASVHRDARISRVIALGGTFRLPGLMKFLQMQLQLDVQRFDALGAAPPGDARVATLLNDNVLSVVSAYGLALQAMNEGKITSSLLPLVIRRERMWRDKTKWFAAAAALVCLGTGVAVGRYFFDQMQYDSAQPARDQIASQLATANDLSTKWKEVEDAGAPERQQIGSLQSLTHLRDLQAKILMTLDKAMPEPAATMPSDKRADRRVLQIDEMTEDYYEDLTPAITKVPDSQFFVMPRVEFIQNLSGTGSGRQAGYYGAGARGAKVLKASLTPGAAPAGMEGDPSAIAAVPGAQQRGFLITMVCTTPKTPWQDLAEQVRNALIAETQPSADPTQKQEFRIERVEIVSGQKLDPTLRAPLARGRANAGNAGNRRPVSAAVAARQRRMGGAGRYDAEMMESEGGGFGQYRPRFGTAQRGGAFAPGGRARPPRPGEETAPPEQLDYPMPTINFDQPMMTDPMVDPNAPAPFVDPLTGEDATNDYRVTFLIAVVVAPAPPAPPTPAPGEEGLPADETAGETASANQ